MHASNLSCILLYVSHITYLGKGTIVEFFQLSLNQGLKRL